MADVIAFVADGIATQNGMILIMADVIAIVSDEIATLSAVYCILFCKFGLFLKIRTIILSVVKLLPVYNMASPGLWKMLTFIILPSSK